MCALLTTKRLNLGFVDFAALEECRSVAMQPLKILIMGVVYAALGDRSTAIQVII